MKLKLFFFCFFIGVVLHAQSTFKGTVYSGGEPLADELVVGWSADDNIDLGAFVYTDEDGYYEFTVDVPDGNYNKYDIRVFDICLEDSLVNVVCLADSTTFEFDFYTCGVEQNECYSSFLYEVGFDNPLQYNFWATPVEATSITYDWDFGFGETSTASSPEVVFPSQGVYDISLTVTTPSCTNTYTHHIYVGCGGCDPSEADVCVLNDAGEIELYESLCHAMVDGYDASDVVDCDQEEEPDCADCPLTCDPVCVEVTMGTSCEPIIITFPNECWANCNGYDESYFVDCEEEEDCDVIQDITYTLIGGGENGFDYVKIQIIKNVTDWEVLNYNWDFTNCDGLVESTLPSNAIVKVPSDGVYTVGYSLVTVDSCVDETSITFSLESDCECEEEYSPVCIETEIDEYPYVELETFPNMCYLECFGFSAADTVSCADTLVCDVDLSNQILQDSFGNATNNVYFSPEVITSGSPVSHWLWEFGDGVTSNESNSTTYSFDEEGWHVITLTIVTASGCTAQDTTNVFIDESTVSTTDVLLDAGFNVFPNPTVDALTVVWQQNMAWQGESYLRIVNVEGQELMTQSVDSAIGENMHTLDVSMYPVGLYFIELLTPEGIVSKKVVKNE